MPYKTDEEFLLMAYRKATESPDPSTQNGAVIPYLRNYTLKSDDHGNKYATLYACNTFPKGVKATPERLERPLKSNYIEHAERNVLHEALRLGVCTYDLTMYVPWAACADCARAIIGSGIKKVVCHKRMMDLTPSRWKESIDHAMTMFKESNVEITMVTSVLNGPQIRFNGELWTP